MKTSTDFTHRFSGHRAATVRATSATRAAQARSSSHCCFAVVVVVSNDDGAGDAGGGGGGGCSRAVSWARR